MQAALGGAPATAALRGPVLAALPTVAAWERELDGLGDAERADLLARADAVAAHRFDLLGSGPVDLGRQIDWQRDFKHGRSWPRVHISQATISLRRRLGHQGAVGAVALPARAAARRRVPGQW